MGTPEGFTYVERSNGEVVISHNGRVSAVLRGRKAAKFLVRITETDPQELMARLTGNYKRGNERR